MAKKSMTFRLSEDVIELINRQQGETMTQKFENLVTRCVWELPEKQKQLERYTKDIKREQKQLSKLSQQVYEYREIVQQLDGKISALGKLLNSLSLDQSV